MAAGGAAYNPLFRIFYFCGHTLDEACTRLGSSVASHKRKSRASFLRIEVNTEASQLCLPSDKLCCFHLLLTQ